MESVAGDCKPALEELARIQGYMFEDAAPTDWISSD